MLTALRKWVEQRGLPAAAKEAMRKDHLGLPHGDPGPNAVIDAATDWLCRAQDNTASGDDGVARDYSLMNGWATSYPETTGYIVPTLLDVATLRGREDLESRARRMLDWFRSIQLDGGGFQGGRIDARPVVPVTFNTGQILIGLAAGARVFGDYQEVMLGAARFLRDSLDTDGCWRSHPTPFAEPGEKAYETHVTWGLFEADRLASAEGFGEAGMRQVRWAIGKQHDNGWVSDCCLNKPDTPLTHTLGYFLKGLVEAHKWSGEESVLAAARRTADGLIGAQRADGSLPGRLGSDWSPAAEWSCLTGNVQVADSWFYLGHELGEKGYIKSAEAANAFVRRTIVLKGDDGVRGGVKGSFPVDGEYGEFEYLNWAAKFTIDSCISELKLAASPTGSKPQ